MNLFLYLGLAFIFLVLNAIFNGAETGFVSLDIDYLRYRARSKKAIRERRLMQIAKSPEKFLALTLIGINSCMVISTSLFTAVFKEHIPGYIELGTFFVSLFIFLCCEFLPKMAFNDRPLKLCLGFLPLFRLAEKIFYVPVVVITFFTRLVMSKLGIGNKEEGERISRDELLILLSYGVNSGTIHEESTEMAKGIIGMKETHVSEIMIPRLNLIALEENTPVEKARKIVIESGYSRIPIYREDIDQIVGILYFKDLFLRLKEGDNLKSILTKPLFVPEMKPAFELFQEMQKKSVQVAVILDEFGSTSGIVTLEDLLEEVFGEIHDEFDKPETELKYNDDGTISVRADMNVSDFNEETEFNLTAIDGVTTLNGLILANLGRIPTTGENFSLNNCKMKIIESDERKIGLIKILNIGKKNETAN
jgi:putative hemolysin